MATHIGPHIKVAGRVFGDDDLLVEGTIDGRVELNASLVIAPGGFVTGDVTVKSVRVEGRFEGRLVADHVHLASTARVDAESLSAGLLQIDDGAKVRAEIAMEIQGSSKVAAKAPASVPVSRPSVARTTVQTAAPSIKAPAKSSNTASAPAARATTVTVVEEVEEAVVEIDMTEYDSMTVKELRDRLKALDLPISGTKPELAERLAEAES